MACELRGGDLGCGLGHVARIGAQGSRRHLHCAELRYRSRTSHDDPDVQVGPLGRHHHIGVGGAVADLQGGKVIRSSWQPAEDEPAGVVRGRHPVERGDHDLGVSDRPARAIHHDPANERCD